jgi:predicted GTPase
MDKYSHYINKLELDIKEIKDEARKIYIVNAGRMNHGKSSLFNSLLDMDEFKVGDIRTTKSRKDVNLFQNVYLVDTPGLDADIQDDKEAVETYKKANMIIFVHTPNIGELHKDEIDHINKIANLFPSKEYFWKHFCLVFTFKEAVSEENLINIKNKILKDIKIHCGGENFPVFEVSNSRYQKGRKENKINLINKSGIKELKNFLNENINIWQQDIRVLQNQRIEKLKEETRRLLLEKRCQIQQIINVKEIKIKNEENRLNRLIEDFYDEITRLVNLYFNKDDEIERLENSISALEERHTREKSRYSGY